MKKPPHVQRTKSFFFSITFARGERRNVTQTKVFLIPKTQSGHLFWRQPGLDCKTLAGHCNHPLINPRSIVCRRKTCGGQSWRSQKKQARMEGFFPSRLVPAGSARIVKGRELTGIASAQRARGFCRFEAAEV